MFSPQDATLINETVPLVANQSRQTTAKDSGQTTTAAAVKLAPGQGATTQAVPEEFTTRTSDILEAPSGKDVPRVDIPGVNTKLPYHVVTEEPVLGTTQGRNGTGKAGK